MEKKNDTIKEIRKKVKDDIVEVINKIIANCKPFTYDDLNFKIMEKQEGSLVAIEKEDDRIGVGLIDYEDKSKGFCTSTIAIIATIIDIAVGERLAFIISDDDKNIVQGVKWYEQ